MKRSELTPEELEKVRAYDREYKRAHQEAKRAYDREYVNRPEVKEKRAAYQKEWAPQYYDIPENKQKAVEYRNRPDVKSQAAKTAREYHSKDEYREHRKKVRQKYLSNPEKHLKNRKAALDYYRRNRDHVLFEKKGKKRACEICGYDKKEALDLHHIVGKAIGGKNNKENKLTVCSNCHRLIHAGLLDLTEFLEKRQ